MCRKSLILTFPTSNWHPIKCDLIRILRCLTSENKSSPKSFGKNMLLPPRQRMHSPIANAVACKMHNEASRRVTGHYGSVMRRYGMLRKHCASLRDVMERYRTLQRVVGCYGTLWLLRNVTESLQKILILPITN